MSCIPFSQSVSISHEEPRKPVQFPFFSRFDLSEAIVFAFASPSTSPTCSASTAGVCISEKILVIMPSAPVKNFALR